MWAVQIGFGVMLARSGPSNRVQFSTLKEHLFYGRELLLLFPLAFLHRVLLASFLHLFRSPKRFLFSFLSSLFLSQFGFPFFSSLLEFIQFSRLNSLKGVEIDGRFARSPWIPLRLNTFKPFLKSTIGVRINFSSFLTFFYILLKYGYEEVPRICQWNNLFSMNTLMSDYTVTVKFTGLACKGVVLVLLSDQFSQNSFLIRLAD